ncbi:MAG: alginate export family protein [Vicinamibacterales bacterium]|nr:alginate export family protein [Vicinamibacterales bacterium]
MACALVAIARGSSGQTPQASVASAAAEPQVAAPPRPPAPTAAAPAAAPASVPVFNRVNQSLPAWLRVRGEFRERMEGFNNVAFTDGRDTNFFLSRVRLQATVTPIRALAFVVQAQDARVANKTVGPTVAPFRDTIDLRMAYAEVGGATAPVAVRLGRQELVYGDQRLLGHVSWLNGARTFDAAKVMVRNKKVNVDMFVSSVVTLNDVAFNKSDFDASRFAGVYATTGKLIPKASVEPYLYYRTARSQRSEAGALADLRQATLGVRWVGTLPARADYNVEVVVQRGSLGTDTIEAWASHWMVRETLTKKYAVKAFGEFNYASGDGNATDGTRGTFDQLYPTPHDKIGLADQAGWRNLRHARAGLELTPRKGVALSTSYHSIWLANTRDALYNAGGVAVARVVGGAASAHVGQEIDAQVSWAVSPILSIAGGYSYLAPGAFLKQATPGASYSSPYLMATYVLFADK